MGRGKKKGKLGMENGIGIFCLRYAAKEKENGKYHPIFNKLHQLINKRTKAD